MCFLVILINILNTGCALYPVYFTCLENFSWTIDKQQVLLMNNWYEQWSKAGANPNFRVEDPETYIQGFNWVGRWIDDYFFNKGSDFILGVFVLISIIYFYLIKTKLIRIKNNKIKFKSIYLIILILLFEWFYNHPALRYGGYTLVCLTLFIPISIIFDQKILNKKILINKTKHLMFIILLVFFARNVDRIYYEVTRYNYNPLKKPFYILTDHHYRIDKEIRSYLINYNECKNNTSNCDKEIPVKIKKVNHILIMNR